MDKNKANVPKIRFPGFTEPWEQRKLGEVMKYEQPTKYIVKSTDYDDSYKTPVLTAGQSFVLGYTNETDDIYYADFDNPVIIFDDFTTSSHYVDFPFKVKSSAMKLLTLKQGNDNFYFVYNVIKNINYTPQSHERHWISKFSDFKIFVPSLVEEDKIGNFFKNLDNLITLHQRKLNHLQDKKKSLLQKMFPRDGKYFPELRFPGFTDPWEQRKLGEIAERVTRKNTELESTLPLTISAQYGLVDQISFFNKRVASRDIRGYYLLRKGEFAYNKSYSEGYPWGAVKRLERYENGVLSTLYICFKLLDVNSNFLVSYYDTNNWYKEVAQRASEGARNHGLLNISADDFFNTKLTIPKSKEEQAAIGCFFQDLDKLITLHQRKLNHLQEQKKSLLQQMFV